MRNLFPFFLLLKQIEKMKALDKIRAVSHQLVSPEFEQPGELVKWMGALQGQDYKMSKWAIGLRMKSGSLKDVNEALRRGEIVRTHVMRPTWHWVAGNDLRWMLKLSASRIRKAVDQWTKGCGIDITESEYTRCNDLFGKLLTGGVCLTKEELANAFEHAGILADDNRLRRYLLRAEVEGLICSGEDRNGKPSYTLLEEHLAPVPDLSREEALAELACRYFRSHAPATLKDFIWWSGLTATDAKKAIASAGNQLIKECYKEQEFWLHVSCRDTRHKPVVHLLPPYDEYLVGYKDRQTVMDPVHFPKAFNNWGIFYPVIFWNGRIIGNWSRTAKQTSPACSFSFFDPSLSSSLPPKELERAENRIRKWREE